jgi:hypothetical protein
VQSTVWLGSAGAVPGVKANGCRPIFKPKLTLTIDQVRVIEKLSNGPLCNLNERELIHTYLKGRCNGRADRKRRAGGSFRAAAQTDAIHQIVDRYELVPIDNGTAQARLPVNGLELGQF